MAVKKKQTKKRLSTMLPFTARKKQRLIRKKLALRRALGMGIRNRRYRAITIGIICTAIRIRIRKCRLIPLRAFGRVTEPKCKRKRCVRRLRRPPCACLRRSAAEMPSYTGITNVPILLLLRLISPYMRAKNALRRRFTGGRHRR